MLQCLLVPFLHPLLKVIFGASEPLQSFLLFFFPGKGESCKFGEEIFRAHWGIGFPSQSHQYEGGKPDRIVSFQCI